MPNVVRNTVLILIFLSLIFFFPKPMGPPREPGSIDETLPMKKCFGFEGDRKYPDRNRKISYTCFGIPYGSNGDPVEAEGEL